MDIKFKNYQELIDSGYLLHSLEGKVHRPNGKTYAFYEGTKERSELQRFANGMKAIIKTILTFGIGLAFPFIRESVSVAWSKLEKKKIARFYVDEDSLPETVKRSQRLFQNTLNPDSSPTPTPSPIPHPSQNTLYGNTDPSPTPSPLPHPSQNTLYGNVDPSPTPSPIPHPSQNTLYENVNPSPTPSPIPHPSQNRLYGNTDPSPTPSPISHPNTLYENVDTSPTSRLSPPIEDEGQLESSFPAWKSLEQLPRTNVEPSSNSSQLEHLNIFRQTIGFQDISAPILLEFLSRLLTNYEAQLLSNYKNACAKNYKQKCMNEGLRYVESDINYLRGGYVEGGEKKDIEGYKNKHAYFKIADLYLQRFFDKYPAVTREQWEPFIPSLVYTALFIAIKQAFDYGIWNSDYVDALPALFTRRNRDLKTVNAMEREFLKVIDYQISFSEEEIGIRFEREVSAEPDANVPFPRNRMLRNS